MNSTVKDEALGTYWNFYEKAIGDYSIIIRVLQYMNEYSDFISRIPNIFVEETPFDTCKIIITHDNIQNEFFYSLISPSDNISSEVIEALNRKNRSPSLYQSVNGYEYIYIYPLKNTLYHIGFIILGKHGPMALSKDVLNSLSVVCDVVNRMLTHYINSHNGSRHTSIFDESIIDNIPDPFLLIDTNDIICYANKRAIEEFKQISDGLSGKKLASIFSDIPELSQKKEAPFSCSIHFPSGETYNIYTVTGYTIERLNLYGLIFRNMSGEKLSHNKQLLTDRVESLSLLAGGIAHDLNNILTSVLGYSSLLRKFLPDNPKLFRYAEVIEHSAHRAAKLTRHLLNFSRRQKKPSDIVNINALLDDLLFLFHESFRDIEIRTSFYDSLPPISGDEAELQSVFLNICLNAKDAMSGKGVLRVRTERKKIPGGNDYVLIQFTDTGKGISAHIRPRIFEAYFSTKEHAENAGIGLYVVNKTVREHGGFIEVDSEEDKGTTFSVFLPLSIDSTESKTPQDYGEKKDLTGKCILIVDDEDMLREFMKALLKEEKAHVLEASNGIEAIKIFKQYQQEIDAVILDIIMPRMKGDEVAKIMKEIKPTIKIIVSTGYMDEERRKKLQQYGIDAFIDKPFRNVDVITVVKNLLF